MSKFKSNNLQKSTRKIYKQIEYKILQTSLETDGNLNQQKNNSTFPEIHETYGQETV